jgi:hypothetical protein
LRLFAYQRIRKLDRGFLDDVFITFRLAPWAASLRVAVSQFHLTRRSLSSSRKILLQGAIKGILLVAPRKA